jgi:ArsR family transcriptional regulator, arsenate/arsenite/antimonite-responsive transcriptional repressor
MDRIYKAIADPTRRAILRLLREKDMTAGGIAAHFPITKPTLSKHFAVLREAGLVRAVRSGRNITYQLSAEVLENALLSLMEDYDFVWRPPIDVEDAARQFVESLVRGDYADLVRDFDETMAAILTPEKLRDTWDGVVGRYGPFVKQIDARIDKYWKFTAVIITCEFGKSKLNIKVVFSRSGQISGLWFLEME